MSSFSAAQGFGVATTLITPQWSTSSRKSFSAPKGTSVAATLYDIVLHNSKPGFQCPTGLWRCRHTTAPGVAALKVMFQWPVGHRRCRHEARIECLENLLMFQCPEGLWRFRHTVHHLTVRAGSGFQCPVGHWRFRHFVQDVWKQKNDVVSVPRRALAFPPPARRDCA